MCGASAIHVNYCKVLREGVIVLVTDENTRKGYNVWTKELEGLYWSVTDIAEPTKKTQNVRTKQDAVDSRTSARKRLADCPQLFLLGNPVGSGCG